MLNLVGVLIAGFLFLANSQAFSGEKPSPAPTATSRSNVYEDEIEKDFPLRSLGLLQITNMRGDLQIQGWSQDKIRVKAKRIITASSPEEAARLRGAVEFRFGESSDGIELAAEYGKGLSLQERIHERQNPRARMEMQVLAPSKLRLRVWAVLGNTVLKSWDAPTEVRSSQGKITIENVHSDSLNVLCPECEIELRSIKASLRCMGGSGKVSLHGVSGAQIYAETESGALEPTQVSGDQLYITKTGAITGTHLDGHIEFHSGEGAVDLKNSEGFLSGRTISGAISAEMLKWNFTDKALFETVSGDINLILPSNFTGELEASSRTGKVDVDFPLVDASGAEIPAHSTGQVRRGRIGAGGELLQITSERGNIHLKRGA